jgi:hypothetical protein
MNPADHDFFCWQHHRHEICSNRERERDYELSKSEHKNKINILILPLALLASC